jgi:ferredoxin
VYPSAALLPRSLKEKQETRIGTAEFVIERCVVFTNGTPCGACAEICPTGYVHMIPYEEGLTISALIGETRIGCGSCELACPAVPVRAITVKGAAEHERISLAGASARRRKVAGRSTCDKSPPSGLCFPSFWRAGFDGRLFP